MTDARPAAIVVLAAGEGTRMRSSTAKVLHRLAGRSMLAHVLAAARALQPEHLLVVVGHAREQVIAHLTEIDPASQAVVQEQQHGTGHAVRVALAGLADLQGTVVVVPGDAPLLTAASLRVLVREHENNQAATTLLTSLVTDPTGYGRVIRDGTGTVVRITEHRDIADGDEQTRQVREVNTSVYAFEAGRLRAALTRLRTDNAQTEEYLTDVAGIHREAGLRVHAVSVPETETVGVNDRAQLAQAAALLRDRINSAHLRAGVAIVDPATTWIDADVVLEPDCTIGPGVQLQQDTSVRTGAVIGPDCTLTATSVGAGASVVRSHAEGAVIGDRAAVGPFSFLRPGAVLGADAKVGAFVEVKASTIGPGSKVPHLSYVGDTTIGAGSNLGAGTVTVNYDGFAKHATRIGDGVRIGSDTMLVAPVQIGDGAVTGAGSTITEDVPTDALALGRARQTIIEGWAARNREQRG